MTASESRVGLDHGPTEVIRGIRTRLDAAGLGTAWPRQERGARQPHRVLGEKLWSRLTPPHFDCAQCALSLSKGRRNRPERCDRALRRRLRQTLEVGATESHQNAAGKCCRAELRVCSSRCLEVPSAHPRSVSWALVRASDTVQFVLHGDRVRTEHLSVARVSTALRTVAFHSKSGSIRSDARLALRLHGSRAVRRRAPVGLSKVLKLDRRCAAGIRVPHC
jgi:hypothetical protein